ncbi:MAG TPA: diaminopimelate epimerase [Longimicrobiales bacterium]|nr:diaminopimelate epimerase [Longimicrobiales bacterium]
MDYGPRPHVGLDWYRAHGLGNDYLVATGDAALADGSPRWPASAAAVERMCDRHLGVGSDGIMIVVGRDEPFPLRAFNPDGSEFERSGNGLRVVASWLHREGWVAGERFEVLIAGDTVGMQVHAHDPATGLYDVSVEMGRARTGPGAVGLDVAALPPRLADLDAVPVSVGNPHMVVWDEDAAIDDVGPALSGSPAFAHGTNVQVVRRIAADRIEIDIWERGVGPTTASGSSSCAAAVAAVRSGRIAPGVIDVVMAGGRLQVTVSADLGVDLRGPVQAIASGRLDPGFARDLRS